MLTGVFAPRILLVVDGVFAPVLRSCSRGFRPGYTPLVYPYTQPLPSLATTLTPDVMRLVIVYGAIAFLVQEGTDMLNC